MKIKYRSNDTVKTATATGTISEVAQFQTHEEFLVQFPDGTASWFHEDKISPAHSPDPHSPDHSATH